MRSKTQMFSVWQELISVAANWCGIGSALVVAASLRLGSIAVFRNWLHPQTWEFGPFAESTASGFGYSELLKDGTRLPSVYMPPGYPYFLAVFYWLGGEGPATFLAIEVVQAALGVLLVYIVYRLAFVLVGKRGSLVAA